MDNDIDDLFADAAFCAVFATVQEIFFYCDRVGEQVNIKAGSIKLGLYFSDRCPGI
jgi:hypothetical protein